ncbi:MAG: nitrate- and nitrite sensing domain-containing protein [Pseudomonadota bacterium]
MAPSRDFRSALPIYVAMFAPMVGLALLAATMILDANDERLRSSGISEAVGRAADASNLAYELQKERGLSAGYVGSRQQAFRDRLLKQRTETDAVLTALRERLVPNQALAEVGDEPGRATRRHERLANALEELGAMRGGVDAFTVTVPDLARFYTGAINDLLSMADDPMLTGAYSDLARQNMLYANILLAKELAGLERAAGAVGFGRGAFDIDTYAWFSSLRERQKLLLDRVDALANEQERAALTAALNNPAVTRLADLRSLARKSIATGEVDGVTGPEWFDASTAYLDELRTLEQTMAAFIRSGALGAAEDAKTWALTVLVAAVAMLGVGMGLSFRYISGMIAALRALRTAILRIEKAEEGITVPATERKDEIGEIARSLSQISSKGAEAARVRAAIDEAASPFLILDSQKISIFENAAFAEMANRRQEAMEELAPLRSDGRRDAEELLQELTIAREQDRLVEKSRGEDAAIIVAPGAFLEARVNGVRDASGREIGTAIQIEDVTEIKLLEAEMLVVMEAAELGRFDRRIQGMDDMGFTSMVARSMNQLLDAIGTFTAALNRCTTAMAQGDLTETVDISFTGDLEGTRQSLNASLAALVDMVASTADAAAEVKSKSARIVGDGHDLAGRAASQAKTLHRVTQEMTTVVASLGSVAAKAQDASGLAGTATNSAGNGRKVLDETRQAMRRIEESSAKIVDIVSLIDAIAGQTNLLALNAAVEAARAGEAGRGFAVVASEVGELAKQSADAAQEIRGLIADSGTHVADGVALMERTDQALVEIERSVDGLFETVTDINAAMGTQSVRVREVGETVHQVESLTAENASTASTNASDAEVLLQQAERLSESVGCFKIASQGLAKAG